MSLGTTKIINLKDLGGGAGLRTQVFPAADGNTRVFTITDFLPDSSNLVVKVNGIEWTDGWELIANDITFDHNLRKNAIVSVEN